jgi:hypothetical protein
MSLSQIHQDILPDRKFPRTITLRRVSPDDAAFHLSQSTAVSDSAETISIGIAYHISQTGKVDFICLSNLTQAFIVSLHSTARAGPGKAFAALLSESSITPYTFCLVGFGMAKVAIQVSQATRMRVSGIDLSTICSPNTREPWSASKFIAEKVENGVDRFKVASLWTGDEGSAERNIALQAWLAAW